jgi:regulator of protease activity HflC (stomatin/prohibitin superfamily)
MDDGDGVKAIGFIIAVILCFVLVIATLTGSFYRINTGQGGILTGAGGMRSAVTDVGWHVRVPFLSDIQITSIVNNNMYFPEDYLDLETKFQGDQQAGAIGYDIKTTDDKVVDTGAVMAYEITDLFQYGVKNTNPQQQLQKEFDAVVFNYLQSQSADNITSHVTDIDDALLQRLRESDLDKQFGIKINSMSLLRPTYTKIALDALAQKQAIQATSEGNLNAAKNQALAIETIAQAQKSQADLLKDVSQQQLDFNAKLALYDALKGQNNVIWVIPSGQPIVLNQAMGQTVQPTQITQPTPTATTS